MKINPALPCTKSCNTIGRYIIKHAVNINSEGFSIFTHDDIPKEIIKGIHAMLQHNHSVALEVDKDDCASEDVSEHTNIVTKDNAEFNDDRSNKKKDSTIKETQQDADNNMNNTNNINIS